MLSDAKTEGTTRVDDVTYDVPQVRESAFYPQSLDKGLRSERVLKLALAEMYIQGVSTRKVAAGHRATVWLLSVI